MALPDYSIGGVDCDLIIAPDGPQELKERVAVFERPGYTGAGSQRLGLAPGEFAYVAVKIDTLANCLTWAAALEALQGDVVTIEDGFETFTDRCLVLHATLTARAAVYSHVSGATHRFEMRIEGKLQEATA